MAITPDGYRWSSHYFYKYGINTFVNTNFILKMISDDKLTAIKQYFQLVNIIEKGNNFDLDFENIKNIFKLNDSNLQFDKDEVVKFMMWLAPKYILYNEVNV